MSIGGNTEESQLKDITSIVEIITSAFKDLNQDQNQNQLCTTKIRNYVEVTNIKNISISRILDLFHCCPHHPNVHAYQPDKQHVFLFNQKGSDINALQQVQTAQQFVPTVRDDVCVTCNNAAKDNEINTLIDAYSKAQEKRRIE